MESFVWGASLFCFFVKIMFATGFRVKGAAFFYINQLALKA
jgi:hypothetical protein